MDERTNELLTRLDLALLTAGKLVERLCREAHMDDATIARILADADADNLEIISDTAGEVLVKAQDLIVEARLAIQTHRRVAT